MRCVALLSAGLDSQLAVRLMTTQGIEVHAINIQTPFESAQDRVEQVARKLDVPLTIVKTEPDYLQLIREPKFGFGRAANPCVDCRIYMAQQAYRFMQQVGAKFVVSGEIVGQRPMSQKRADLEVISHHSGLDDLLLRPLSAKSFPPTLPEREGWVDKELLFGFWGRGRRSLIALARKLGLEDIPMPSTGCALTEIAFSRKVFDLVLHQSNPGPWDFDLLKHGRHFRVDEQCKVIVGRSESENLFLEQMGRHPDAKDVAVIIPLNFVGPMALVVGLITDRNLQFAATLLIRYGKAERNDVHRVRVEAGSTTRCLDVKPDSNALSARTLAMSRR